MSQDLKIQVVLNTVDKMTAPMRKALGVSSEMEDQLAATRRELRDLNKTSKNMAAYKALKLNSAETGKALEKTRSNAKRLALQFTSNQRTNKALAESLEQAKLQTLALAQQVDKAEQPSEELNLKFKESQKLTEKLTAEFRIAENATNRLSTRFDNARKSVNRLKNKQVSEIRSLDQLRVKFKEAGVSASRLTQAQKDIAQQTQKATQSLTDQAKQLQTLQDKHRAAGKLRYQRDRSMQMASNMTIAGAGAMYTGRGILNNTVMPAINDAVDDEAAFAGVKKVVDFGNTEDAEAFRVELQKMSMDMPIAATGLYDIAAAGGQLGVAKEGLKDFTNTVAMMSTAFDMSADSAGDSMAKLSNIYKIPISELEDIGDAINHLSNNTAAKAGHIVDTLSRIGGVSKEFGLTVVQAGALSDAMIALGKSPEVAATGINALLQKMQTARIQGKPFQKGLAEIGMTAEELETKVRDNAQGALLDFLKTLEKLPKESRMNVIGQMFGAEYADDISLLVGSLGEYEKALNLVGDAGNYAFSMQQEFDSKNAATKANLQKLENQMKGLRVEMGNALLPTINELLKEIRPLIASTMQWAKENPQVVKTLMMATVAVAGLIAVGGGLTMMMGSVLAPMIMAKFAFKSLGLSAGSLGSALRIVITVVRALGVALIANPIGAAIAAIALGAYLIYDNWDFLVKWWNSWTLKDIGYGIGKKLGQTAAWLSGKWKQFQTWWNNATFSEILLSIPINPITTIINLARKFFNWWNGSKLTEKKANVQTIGIDGAWQKAKDFASWWNNNMTLRSIVGKVSAGISSGFSDGYKDGGARAGGGPIAAGSFYEVNELGPELVTMAGKTYLMANMPGKITPLIQSAANDANPVNQPAQSRFEDPKVADLLAVRANRNYQSQSVSSPMNVNITINPSEGMDEKSIGEAVNQKLRRLQQQQSRRSRGQLFDDVG